MNSHADNLHTATRFVSYLPDLITEEDYLDPPEVKKIRVKICRTEQGVDVVGDSMYADLLEEFLANIGTAEIERMLCG